MSNEWGIKVKVDYLIDISPLFLQGCGLSLDRFALCLPPYCSCLGQV